MRVNNREQCSLLFYTPIPLCLVALRKYDFPLLSNTVKKIHILRKVEEKGSFISLLILILLLYVLFIMFRGFYLNIVLGLVLAVALRPVQLRILNLFRGKKRLSTLLTILLTVILILIPLLVLLRILAVEAINVGRNTRLEGLEKSLDTVVNQVNFIAKERTGYTGIVQKEDVISFIQSRATDVGERLLGILSNFFSIIASSVILFMTIYYSLVEWENIRDFIYKNSLLTRTTTIRMASRALEVIRATIRGNIVMIFFQALVGGIGLYLFGIKAALLLGALYGLASLVPTIGTGTVWIPSVIFLALTGHTLSALGLTLWNMAVVGTLDNFVMPALVKKGSNLHPFLILIGVLGGISLFGLVGFIIGPTLIALTIVSIEMYKDNSLDYEEN